MNTGSGASEHGQAVIGLDLRIARADLHYGGAVRFHVDRRVENRQRHVFEARMKEDGRTHGERHHEGHPGASEG